MAESNGAPAGLSAEAARQLANTTKTPPQWIGVTPRWLVSLLPWTPVEAGTYRVNKVKQASESEISIQCSPTEGDELPQAFIDYEASNTTVAWYPPRTWSAGGEAVCTARAMLRAVAYWNDIAE